MADIFLSYSSKDKERVRPLVHALEREGWTVWWDRKIPARETFDQMIERELSASRCVVVVWSHDSVQSLWVREEAEDGRARNLLFPARIDQVTIPIGFRLIQGVDLVGWQGNPDNSDFQHLVQSIKDKIGAQKQKAIVSDPEPIVDSKVKKIPEIAEDSKPHLVSKKTTNVIVPNASTVVCTSIKEEGGTITEPIMTENKKSYIEVPVFFGTDRNVKKNKRQCLKFGSNRSNIKYGKCDISIPLDHKIGELESPSIWRLEWREDLAKHVVLLEATLMDKANFFQDISAKSCQSQKKNAFLFIHGYSVTFEDAARRTAQMAVDLKFTGVPMFYSWPSKGRATLQDYLKDEQSIEWAEANLRKFLEDIFQNTEVQHLYLIAHSMGNRALTRAVNELLNDRPDFRNRLKEVILAAPDIDADVFKSKIAPKLIASCGPVTLYASSRDRALAASNKVHGHPRAGDSGQGLIVCKGIETIDATHVDTSLLGHSYYAESRSVLSDMFYLISLDQRADKRFGLRPVKTSDVPYWEFEP